MAHNILQLRAPAAGGGCTALSLVHAVQCPDTLIDMWRTRLPGQVEEACGYVPPTILTSSKNGRGRNELLAHVAQLREFYNKQHHGM